MRLGRTDQLVTRNPTRNQQAWTVLDADDEHQTSRSAFVSGPLTDILSGRLMGFSFTDDWDVPSVSVRKTAKRRGGFDTHRFAASCSSRQNFLTTIRGRLSGIDFQLKARRTAPVRHRGALSKWTRVTPLCDALHDVFGFVSRLPDGIGNRNIYTIEDSGVQNARTRAVR